jgi:hypothetical protein
MRTKIRAVVATAVAASGLMFPFDAASARCSVPSFNFTFGQPGSTGMTVGSGESCNIKLREANVSVFQRTSVAARPAKGSVTVPNPINITYRARPGQQGQDSFVIKISGTREGAPKTTLLTVAVQIEGRGGATAAVGAAAASRERPQQATAASALRAKCLQDVGAGRDPVTGRMQFYLNHPSRMDQYKMCLAGGDRAKANAMAVPELSRVHPGDRGPTYKGR